MFNRWKSYPKYKPSKRGWYICSIRYGEEPGQAYVMDLFWDENEEKWKDNRRLDVYYTYEDVPLKIFYPSDIERFKSENEEAFNREYYCKYETV